MCLVWGTTYLAIRIALESMPPLLMAGSRWTVAGCLLIGVVALRTTTLPPRRAWASLAVRGILFLGFGNGAVVWAERTVPSGLTAVFVAIVPFWMVGIDAWLGDGDPLGARQLSGLFVGFAGILLLVWPELGTGVSGGTFLGGFVSTQLACAGWALGSAYARRRGRPEHEETTVASAAFEMLFGGLFLLICGLATREWSSIAVTPRSASAFFYLIIAGSLGGFLAYRYALQHLPVATVSLYAYANTAIAVVLGTLVLGETLNWRTGIAAAVVLAGIGLVKGGKD